MKRWLIVPAVLLVSLVAAPAVFAKVLTGENTTVANSETINDDLFVSGQSILIEGTVNGDVYAAGNNVTVKGTINGDLIAVGQVVEIQGTVRDHVRAIGQTVEFSSATVGNGVSVTGQTIITDSATTIGGGVLVAGQTVSLNAKVARGIMAAAGAMKINGEIGGEVRALTKSLTFGSTAVVNGKVSYRSNNVAKVENGAQLNGGIVRGAPIAQPQRNAGARRFGFALAWLLSSLLVGALVLWLFPKSAEAVSSNLLTKPLASLGVGLVALIVTLPIAVLTMVTVIGIPIGVMLMIGFAIELYFTHIVVAAVIGDWLLRLGGGKVNHYLGLLVGLIVLALVGFIPFLNTLESLLVIVGGLGAIVIAKWQFIQVSRRA